jgi:protein-tyrosine phosphatase
MIPKEKTSILFVCMGNICRSPTAKGVMRRFIDEAGMQEQFVVDSAGTHDYHVGEPPDPRAQAVALRRGYDLSAFRARQVREEDFTDFDLLLVMDFNNLAAIQDRCPIEHQGKVGLLMPYAVNRCASIVHDPYYRSAKDFDVVLDYIEDACKGLLHTLMEGREAFPHGSAVFRELGKAAS